MAQISVVNMAKLSDLPVEILLLIFRMLEDPIEHCCNPLEASRSMCMLVCRQWYEIIMGMTLLPSPTGTFRQPPSLFRSGDDMFKSFINDMFKSVDLLKWSQILELPDYCNKKPYHKHATMFAVKNGNIDVLKYVVDVKGCKYSLPTYRLCVNNHYMDMLKVLILKADDYGSFYKFHIVEGAKIYPHVMKCLHELKISIDSWI